MARFGVSSTPQTSPDVNPHPTSMDSAFRVWRRALSWLVLGLLLRVGSVVSAQGQTGSIRGVVLDGDFGGTPLADARVVNLQTGQEATSGPQGDYLMRDVPAGTYTLIFSREGFLRQAKYNVVVVAGDFVEVDATLEGELSDLDEFVVEDILQLGTGSEAALLQLRLESPALVDAVSSELMSRAGAGDAASALRLVAGASIQDGKFAVIRGLPDRYVNSQLNGVRLPSSDEEKRAVELDQFPSTVIESIQVSKTFTPDQQGDASGGAVNVVLKGVPDVNEVTAKGQWSVNTNVRFREDFPSYNGGGLDFWGRGKGRTGVQNTPGSWRGAVGISDVDSPIDSKWSMAASRFFEIDKDTRAGAFATFFYERDSSYRSGENNRYWIDPDQSSTALTPAYDQGDPGEGQFVTSLFDIREGSQQVQWGGLATMGLETPDHELGLNFLYTFTAQDRAALATDTRGKEAFFPGYDPFDPNHPGNDEDLLLAAPYLRSQTLEYTERKAATLQATGSHLLPFDGGRLFNSLRFGQPEVNWSLSGSQATFNQPDKRLFGVRWTPFPDGDEGPDGETGQYLPFFPAENVNLGNVQRIFKTIEEDSQQLSIDFDLPFTQWDELEGKFKLGMFVDRVDREFRTDSFSNFNETVGDIIRPSDFDDFYSDVWPFESHPLEDAPTDIDYDGEQDITAWYGMFQLPINEDLEVVGGVRVEDSSLTTTVDGDPQAQYINADGLLALFGTDPDAADVDFESEDVLPALSFTYRATSDVTLRAAYSETIARQTFREVSPVIQAEFVGAAAFAGNPNLQLASLTNYDLRMDYEPFDGSLLSLSWFRKDVEDPIETVQRIFADFSYTTVTNYPDGSLTGYELEIRQDLAKFNPRLEGWSVGGNATFIDSEVSLPDEFIIDLTQENYDVPFTRDASNAPEHLYNLYVNLDLPDQGARATLFYTVTGDTLVAGSGISEDRFVPDLYQLEFGTLNFSYAQRLNDRWNLQFQAKNLLNPDIETAYRSDLVTNNNEIAETFTRGAEFSIGVTWSPIRD